MSLRAGYIRFGKLISPIAVIGLRIYTLITRHPRVRILVMNEKSEILLLKGIISNVDHWTLPGGGVNYRESLAVAAARELMEETGIKKPVYKFTAMRIVQKSEIDLPYVAPLFSITVDKNDLPKLLHNPNEIAEVGWFKRDKLPNNTAKIVHLAIAEYDLMTGH